MSRFNVHEWNYKRRLASLNEEMYPKRGEKIVDLTAGQPRVYVPEGDYKVALASGAEPLKNSNGTLIINRPQGLEGVGYILVAFKDSDALDTYVNVRGYDVYDVILTTPGSETGGEEGGVVVKDISSKVPKVGTPGQPDEVIKEAADDDIDDNVKLIAAHMSTQEALEKLVAEFDLIDRTEHCPGGKAEIARALRYIVADNKLTGDTEDLG